MIEIRGTVVGGKIEVEGEPLPEGIEVTVLVPVKGEGFELTDEQWAELEAASAAIERGEGIPADQALAAIRRPKGGPSSR